MSTETGEELVHARCPQFSNMEPEAKTAESAGYNWELWFQSSSTNCDQSHQNVSQFISALS